ncbi:hypothetical protein BpHYR1_047208 [Brachionus plicatilis]|uniref:Uncharacterized protein n=1 Tax=Brachionus plicatilis TaxID=10195 RepID=A0A3M7QFS6_BRAPC|nr:hypothetical protein BpHYR1_047208 [Brachionus plicatilis]
MNIRLNSFSPRKQLKATINVHYFEFLAIKREKSISIYHYQSSLKEKSHKSNQVRAKGLCLRTFKQM